MTIISCCSLAVSTPVEVSVAVCACAAKLTTVQPGTAAAIQTSTSNCRLNFQSKPTVDPHARPALRAALRFREVKRTPPPGYAAYFSEIAHSAARHSKPVAVPVVDCRMRCEVRCAPFPLPKNALADPVWFLDLVTVRT